LDRILVDFLLREGHYETADQLAREGEVAGLVNADLFEGSRQVEVGLRDKNCTVALAWCAHNRVRLEKLKSTLEFKIRLQEFVLVLKTGDRHAGLAYAQIHFPLYTDRHLPAIQAVMALLAFTGKHPTSAKCTYYFAEERWDDLVKIFRNNNFVINSLASQSLLSTTLQSGLSVLKSPLCYDSETHNQNCPICTEHMNLLAADLPLAHHTTSKLVCGVTGALMDANNPPMALPNGHVYGQTALTAMVDVHGVITCPRSGDVYRQSDMQKVFVM
jgi:macrophage erythroblast attacher